MAISGLHAFDARSGAQAARAPGHPVERALATLREWRRRSRGRADLAALDDRMLQDIGITRAEAEFLSHKPFWRE
ncbi:MAG TPA: DUF1127 domain-containing protein [Stellaceae bacterium]|nr:DUF1127 domain-containing protein [Stellaceae bacterium]